MTVTNPVNDNIADGDASTTVFSFTFSLPAGSTGTDVFVYVIDDAGNITLLTSNYTLDVNAKTVTYPVVGSIAPLAAGINALPVGWQIAIYRVEPLTQSLNMTTQGPFPAAGLMAALDYLTLITQQLQEQINRCVKYPIGEAPTTTGVDDFLAAVAAVIPPFTVGTMTYLKTISAAAPTTKRWGFATDQNGGQGQVCFYTANTAVGDVGWIMMPTAQIGGSF